MTKQGGWESTGFGRRLAELREAKGLSQAQLAEAAGCHRITVSKMERGEQEPAWPLVLAICAALGVTCEAFSAIPSAPPAVVPDVPSAPSKGKRPAKGADAGSGAKKGKGKAGK